MTKEGWPVAQPRLSRRPSASTITLRRGKAEGGQSGRELIQGGIYKAACGCMRCRQAGAARGRPAPPGLGPGRVARLMPTHTAPKFKATHPWPSGKMKRSTWGLMFCLQLQGIDRQQCRAGQQSMHGGRSGSRRGQAGRAAGTKLHPANFHQISSTFHAFALQASPLDARNRHEAGHVNFVVEVPNVANDGVVLHLRHVGGLRKMGPSCRWWWPRRRQAACSHPYQLPAVIPYRQCKPHHDDVLVAGGGDEDVDGAHAVLQGGNLVALHRRLRVCKGVGRGGE